MLLMKKEKENERYEEIAELTHKVGKPLRFEQDLVGLAGD